MSENKKTRSQVLKELEAAKRAIDAMPDFEAVIREYDDFFTFSVMETCDDTSLAHSDNMYYTPDPDSKIQALEKAHKLQIEKENDDSVAWCSCIRHGSDSSGYSVEWHDSNTRREYFPFAADPKPEVPPKGTPVESENGFLYKSEGGFDDNGRLIAKNNVKKVVHCKTWHSLTTDHKSADWGEYDD